MRKATVARKTKETDITVTVNLVAHVPGCLRAKICTHERSSLSPARLSPII